MAGSGVTCPRCRFSCPPRTAKCPICQISLSASAIKKMASLSMHDASEGTGIRFHLPDRNTVFNAEMLHTFKDLLKELNWDTKRTRLAVRKYATWQYQPRGNVPVKDIIPPGLKVLKGLIGCLFQQAKHFSGTDIIPIQVYINLYEDGKMSCPAHSTTTYDFPGGPRTLMVNHTAITMNHGDAIILHGQKHSVPIDKRVQTSRISINLHFMIASEAAASNIKKPVLSAKKSKSVKHESVSRKRARSEEEHETKAEKQMARCSVSKKLVRDTKWLTEAASSAKLSNVHIVRYSTTREIDPGKIDRFSPEMFTQWHWFLVGRLRTSALDKDGRCSFNLQLDKFLMGKGKAERVPLASFKYGRKGASLCTYGCQLPSMSSLAILKKKHKFLLQHISDSKKDKSGMGHDFSKKSRKGKEKNSAKISHSDLTQIPHSWNHLTATWNLLLADRPSSTLEFRTEDVKATETTINTVKSTINARGEFHVAASVSNKMLPRLTGKQWLIVADQVGTKIRPSTQEIYLEGIQIPLNQSDSKASALEQERLQTLSKLGRQLQKTQSL
eukprot:CAMPEP_0114490912 /NCGR_PEP_ID=MMETSP0109-20121206/2707_1 /TAXON_ID=29199 /ORGANISM="Chlorarachnion reptans, Strain CCCM449" /LENGTH=555 /DNA_ID=CAMNT_0001667585 /DNA_START=41 /DNA_END=1709 /DNA_ORIENTATION=+